MVSTPRGRGRPRKEADINYPRRLESMRMIKEMVNEGDSDSTERYDRAYRGSGHGSEVNKTLDTRDIVIHPPETPRVQEETEDDGISVLDKKEQQNVNYRCNDCGALLIHEQPRCSCGSRLHWDQVDA